MEKTVFIATYGCHLASDGEPTLSTEHRDIGLFTETEVTTLTIPAGYRRSIRTWFSHPARPED